jgi:uncharacterized protein YkwD
MRTFGFVLRIFAASVVLAVFVFTPAAGTAAPFSESLRVASMHPEVRLLQEFLSSLPGIYPEQKITGYYGALTQAAVGRFQAAYGIPQAGVVGPLTRAKLNELYAARSGTSSAVTPAPAATAVAGEIPSRSAYELDEIADEIHRLINRERRRADETELSWSESLAEVARLHSEDQARDNVTIVPFEKPCTYPILRHIGLTSENFSVLDRILAKVKSGFRRGGENIVTFPATGRSYYEPPAGSRIRCADITQEHSEEGTVAERIAEYRAELALRQNLIAQTPSVTWVRREWKTEEELAERAVELWLSSPGHKKNMLNASFRKAGIGIAWANHYLIITQVFTD